MGEGYQPTKSTLKEPPECGSAVVRTKGTVLTVSPDYSQFLTKTTVSELKTAVFESFLDFFVVIRPRFCGECEFFVKNKEENNGGDCVCGANLLETYHTSGKLHVFKAKHVLTDSGSCVNGVKRGGFGG